MGAAKNVELRAQTSEARRLPIARASVPCPMRDTVAVELLFNYLFIGRKYLDSRLYQREASPAKILSLDERFRHTNSA